MTDLNPRAWSIDGECWCTRVDYDGYKKEWSGVAPVLAPDNRSKRIGEIVDTNIIVEFPTGFKDKNGKEICEGDIIRCHGDDRFIAPVIRHDNSGGFCWVSCYKEECFIPESDEVEVIGNIHENPELIEKEKE